MLLTVFFNKEDVNDYEYALESQSQDVITQKSCIFSVMTKKQIYRNSVHLCNLLIFSSNIKWKT